LNVLAKVGLPANGPAPARMGRGERAAVGLATAGLALALILLVAGPAPKAEATAAPPRAAPEAPLRAVPRPLEVFALDSRALARFERRYEAFAREGGEREDHLVWLDRGERRDVEALFVVRRDPPAARVGLHVETARLAARRGVSVVRSGAPARMDTKFGPFEVADVVLSGADGGRACLAFRSALAEAAPIAFLGWRCARADEDAGRPALRCLIDRATVLAAGEEVFMRGVFARAELRRADCPRERPAAHRKARWYEADSALPALRAAFSPTHGRIPRAKSKNRRRRA
jgi:hypothetical protein